MECCTELCIALLTLVAITIAYLKWTYSYWERKSVPTMKSCVPFGCKEGAFDMVKGMGVFFKERYDYFKSRGHQHGGLYFMTKPVYVAISPELIKNILTKDFQHFTDHGVGSNEKADPLNAHLFNLTGDKWRHLRAKLTHTFTSGKMKAMFPIVVDCGNQLISHVDGLCSEEKPVSIKETLACFGTDVIGSCAFGLECNSFKDPDAEFRKYGRKINELTMLMLFKHACNFAIPKVVEFFQVRLIPKDVSAFFMDAFKGIVEYREKNAVRRNDFVQLLMELKQKPDEEDDGLTVEQMAAQAYIFFMAGFETSATTVTFCLYELCIDQDIQQKVRDEIERVMEEHGDQLTYDGIIEMKYMDQVISETLRKYLPVPMITRECTKEYKVPGTDVIIEKGTKIFISATGLHLDPEYHPDPDKFDPERFSEKNVKDIVPYTYLPFGEGPRVCIGQRFAMMQLKVALALLLKNFALTLNEKTKVPLEFDQKSAILTSKTEIFLDTRKITQ